MLVVDDHPVVRQGIKLVINAEPDFTVCGEAENEQAARRMLRELQPDALVVDLSSAPVAMASTSCATYTRISRNCPSS